MRKQLGKIQKVRFGYVGYQNAMMGISFTFGGDDWGVGTCITGGWGKSIEANDRSEWTEESRNKERAELVEKIDDLLDKAKVDDVYKLKGLPVEITFDGNTLKDWRLLTEVL